MVDPSAKPIVLEPIMKVECEGPAEFQGAILRTLMSRRGLVIGIFGASLSAGQLVFVPLLMAVLLHDIAKPATRTWDEAAGRIDTPQ